ncbi:MAG: hypothetical protein A2V78_08315 [Betaproteobacteria bacterium RBG_16_64_18]|nr:MAG: hypothetical protein A2V78_08315 [Betaproteobacteria bacterium RBG_16_64_18]
MKAEDVARYLTENPEFFEQYSEMLSQISVSSPHGGRAIALSDRQVLTLREKIRVLEAKLSELIQFGEENDAIGEKMHRLALALLACRDLSALLSALYYNLREDFVVPHVALRVWRGSDAAQRAEVMPEFRAVSAELIQYAGALAEPYCGPSGNVEAAGWFGEAASHVRSVALMPLRDGTCFGMLALGSEDAMRYHSKMGTLHLQRLGELAGASLARFL